MNSTVIENEMDTPTTLQYVITSEPMQDKAVKKLPRKAKDLIEQLHDQIQYFPEDAVPKLLKLIKKYPDVPIFYNYLSVAYKSLGRKEEYEKTLLMLYETHPDYLFGRLGYAEYLLQKGEYSKIPEVFDNKYDLKQLYPNRNQFHVTEAAAFMGIMALYWIAIGDRDIAKRYSDMLKQVAPKHQVTRQVAKKLNPIRSLLW